MTPQRYELIRAGLIVAGSVLFDFGLYQIHPPSAFMAAGVELIAFALLMSLTNR